MRYKPKLETETFQHVHLAVCHLSILSKIQLLFTRFLGIEANMGIPMVALAKLNLLLSKSHTGTSLITCLLCPYVLKLTFSVRLVRQAYTDLLYSSRLFLFQLSQIAFDADDQPAALAGNSTRLGRALRLLNQRVTRARRSPTAQDDEDNFHALSMFSL
ncbi:hypothetical protein Peur_002870 [Populus x canadensis]